MRGCEPAYNIINMYMTGIASAEVRGLQLMCKLTCEKKPRYIYIGACVGALATAVVAGISLGCGRGVRRGVREAPPVRSRTAGPSRPTHSGRAQTHRTESLRRPPICAASSRCVSARPRHQQYHGPAHPTHRGGLWTRSCGSEASSFSPTAPREDQFWPRTGCVGLSRPWVS